MLKKGTLVANMRVSLDRCSGDVIGIDRGALFLAQQGLRMVFSVGDFDSVSETERELIYQMSDEVIQLEPMKDYSDSQVAIQECKKRGYTDLLFLGSLGGRVDHHYVNQAVCSQEKEVHIILENDSNRVFTLNEGRHRIFKDNFTYVSFFALEDAVVSLMNFKYELHNYPMDTKNLVGLSNEILNEIGDIEISSGRILVMQTRDEHK